MTTLPSLPKQIRSVGFYMLTLLFWGAIALTAINYFSPPLMSKITAMYDDNVSSWDAKSCQSSPIRCLEAKHRELKDLQITLKQSLQQLSEQVEQNERLLKGRQRIVENNARLVSEGERLLAEVPEGVSSIDLWLAGQHFSKLESLEQQLQLLKHEKSSLENQIAQASRIKKRLIEKRETLMINRGELNVELSLIPSKLALLQSEQFVADFDDSIVRIDSLLSDSYADLEDVSDVLLSTEDFMKKQSELN